MLVNHSHERLIALRLTGMAKAFDDQLRQPDIDALALSDDEIQGVVDHVRGATR